MLEDVRRWYKLWKNKGTWEELEVLISGEIVAWSMEVKVRFLEKVICEPEGMPVMCVFGGNFQEEKTNRERSTVMLKGELEANYS